MLRTHWTFFCAAAMLIFAPTLTNAADPRVELQRNPFERPVMETLKVNAAASSDASSAGGDPGLRAVLVAGTKSVVDFGGVIIKVGESANGYQLLAVEEGRAIFRNKGKKIVFSIYEQDRGSEQ